jgi:hypothetical protein
LPFWCLLTAACLCFWLGSWRIIGCFDFMFIALVIFTSKLSGLYICLFHCDFFPPSLAVLYSLRPRAGVVSLCDNVSLLCWVTPGPYVEGNCMRSMWLVAHRMKLGLRPFNHRIRRNITI